MHICFYSKKSFYRKKNEMMIMKEKRIQINSNEFGSFRIITCPVCGFTFRLIDIKTRKNKKNCPLCGGRLFGLDFSKFMYLDRYITTQKVR